MKLDELKPLAQELGAATPGCVWRDENDLVLWDGPENADVVIQGINPGPWEMVYGRPFSTIPSSERFYTQTAGEVLDHLLAYVAKKHDEPRLLRENVFVTNACKVMFTSDGTWKDPRENKYHGNVAPTAKSIADQWKPLFVHEMEIVKPKVVVVMGKFPLLQHQSKVNNVSTMRITDMVGTTIAPNKTDRPYYIAPSIHPATLLHRRSEGQQAMNETKQQLISVMEAVVRVLQLTK